ncbi:Hypothetical predicted protein [Lecanosticta acicola]|uniref:DUF7492 domain-containing protein n=1 Tax=Lecanosticta acicola TaxID=111012 RepID=A0AAI8Z2G1_9PEZI|nr:Hypothetical predicted protein [Lecanosticta acicola]
MTPTMFSTTIALLALVANLSPLALAHSWVEEFQVISPNGSFVGERGYSRGFVARDDPTFTGFSEEWILPALALTNADGTTRTRINSSDNLCHPAQRTANYTAKFPKLKVSPGDYVAAKYLENGHVSLPWNITGKPPGGGTVFIYGTTTPSPEEKIVDVLKWNSEGTGGNKKGFLMTAQNFDDGRCAQINCGSISQQRHMLQPNHMAGQPTSTFESWCENDLKIPENTQAGTLTVYWIWQWPTEPNMDCNNPAGKDEYYTTCADFDVVDSSENQKIKQIPFSVGAGGNPRSVAVSNYKSRTAYTTSPSIISMQGTKTMGDVASLATSFVSQCSADASVKSGLVLWPQVYVPNTCAVVSTFGAAAASSAAAVFNKAASAYSASSSAAVSSAYAAANMKIPKETPWSQAPASQGQQATATTAPASTPSSAAAATSTPASYSSASDADSVQVTTITTVIVLTSTIPAGQTAPPTTSSADASGSSALSSAAASAPSSAASAPSSAASSVSSDVPNSYSIQTVATVGGVAASSAAAKVRRHPRHFEAM